MYQKVGVSRFYTRHNKAENQELTECRNWRRVLEKEKAFWKLLTYFRETNLQSREYKNCICICCIKQVIFALLVKNVFCYP